MSLFDNALREPSPLIASDPDEARRLAQMKSFLAQAGLPQAGGTGRLKTPEMIAPTALQAGLPSPGLFKGDLFDRMAQIPHTQIRMPPGEDPSLSMDMGMPRPLEMSSEVQPGSTDIASSVGDIVSRLGKLGGKEEEDPYDKLKSLLATAGVTIEALNKAESLSKGEGESRVSSRFGTGKGSDAKGPEGFGYNVGNIRATDINWAGKGTPHNGFETFDTPQSGASAMYSNLRSYASKSPQLTVGGAIARWAPPSENDTANYIAFVQKEAGLDPNLPLALVLQDPDQASRLMYAMAKMEKGKGLPAVFTPEFFRSVVAGTQAPPT